MGADSIVDARKKLDRQFASAVRKLVDQSSNDEQRKSRQAANLRSDPSRQYLYVPHPGDPLSGKPKFDDELARVQVIYGERLFKLAQRAAQEGQSATSYRWLNEVLRYVPDHAEANRILVRHERIPQPRPGRRAHAKYGWSAGKYLQLDTPHFRITTNGPETSARALAETLEIVQATWRQLFFNYWANDAMLQAAFKGRPLVTRRRARHQVVLFRDREEYISQVERIEPQAKMTLGYYHAPSRTAFFFGNEENRSTWRHEATHQLFHETRNTKLGTGESSHFWIVEGIALYMESLQRCQGYVTLGGLEADRLQFARFRVLRESFYEPFDRFSQMGRVDLQQDPRIRQLYSQAAGFTHFLMHHREGVYRESLLRYLEQVYDQSADVDTLSELVGRSYAELDNEYRQFLDVDDYALQQLDAEATLRRLALGGTQVTSNGLSSLANTESLVWLDLAGTRVGDEGLAFLRNAKALEQLTLEATDVTDLTVSRLENCRQLQELDLSNTAITDTATGTIGTLSELRSLWLSRTGITDAGLPALADLEQLQTLDLSETEITPAARTRLIRSLPKLD